ncbi:hypothetical protein SAMN05421740_103465 [Parapedobacter koreensis]|uniref:Uncharacterized protein n=2 Tax=Parapedobacter koreensis TaxID=332977 RepID=A0A1H7MD04_9SPHI|nr:hypothetical protein SAMN05421740_103465 [Parapedobacter koreensis]
MLKTASFFKVEKDLFYKQGEEKGAEQKSYEVVSNLILDFGFNDEQAARASQTSIDFVKKVRADLDKKKK